MSKLTQSIAILGVVAGLGVAALPLSTYAADPTEIKGTGTPLATPAEDGQVPVQLTITETLSMYITNEGGTEQFTSPVELTQNGSDKAHYESTPIAVKVESKNKDGYYLNMYGSAGTKQNNAVNANALTNENGKEIVAGDLTGTVSQWGYKVLKGANGSTLDATWNPVAATPATADTIDSLNAAGVQTTKVTFGANVIDGQESGTYKGQVTFIATAGAKA